MLPEWERGEKQPTFRQLEDFAKATLTPFGAFFLPEPPQERLPVPDFRTMRDQRPKRPSAALLETIYQMQRRQEWMRDYLKEEGEDPLPFIGTVTLASSPVAAAEDIRCTLGIGAGVGRRRTRRGPAPSGHETRHRGRRRAGRSERVLQQQHQALTPRSSEVSFV
jgi:hypothetical protein